jgi:hypothetical protein
MKYAVVVTLQVEGIHSWPTCPIEEVDFLKLPHRHIFHVKAMKEVRHKDREVEIIMLKRAMKLFLDKFEGNFGTMSCEQIASVLVENFDLVNCEVLEDNENGAKVVR